MLLSIVRVNQKIDSLLCGSIDWCRQRPWETQESRSGASLGHPTWNTFGALTARSDGFPLAGPLADLKAGPTEMNTNKLNHHQRCRLRPMAPESCA